VDIVAGGTHALRHRGVYVLVFEFGFLMAIVTKCGQIRFKSYAVPIFWMLPAPFFYMARITAYLQRTADVLCVSAEIPVAF